MRTGGSAGGVPSAWGKKRVWSSGLTGGRKTGTVTAGSSEEKGRTEEDVLGVRSLMLVGADEVTASGLSSWWFYLPSCLLWTSFSLLAWFFLRALCCWLWRGRFSFPGR